MRLAKKIALGLVALLIILALATFLYLSPYSPYQYGSYIPRDLADAHRYLIKHMAPETLAEIKQMKSEDRMIRFHMGPGMGMRNGWGLWRGSRLSRYFNQIGIRHPDDMSSIILDTLWCEVHGQSLRLEERVLEYQDYWKPTTVPDGLTTTTGELLEFGSSIPLGTTEKPRTVHITTANDGRKWTWEYGVGVAPMSAETQQQIDQFHRDFEAAQKGKLN